MYRITQLAQRQGLSRSTLLHYDRIGLLHASDRSPSGYRIYTELEFEKREAQIEERGEKSWTPTKFTQS